MLITKIYIKIYTCFFTFHFCTKIMFDLCVQKRLCSIETVHLYKLVNVSNDLTVNVILNENRIRENNDFYIATNESFIFMRFIR